MLKKVIIGLICFILLLIAGAGIYLYTLDWNKHKTLVSQRLLQITGLKSSINGNLKVELLPQPKITVQQVKFFSPSDSKNPLISVNEITANLELTPLFDNKFIVKSMSLTQPSVNITIAENGELNWKDVGKNSRNKSGNVEMSFNDVRLNGATINYSDLRNKAEYAIPNISASVSAPSLKGPYKTNGKFIHNNSEILFKGNISHNDKISLNMTIENAATGSRLSIDGDMGEQAKGTVNFDTKSLTDIVTIIFGQDSFNDNYKEPLYFSFQYDYNASLIKLENFAAKYGNNITGSGNVMLSLEETKNIAAEFNMAQFDLNVLETVVRDYVNAHHAAEEKNIPDYGVSFRLRAPTALYKGAETQNLNFGFNYKEGILDITSFGVVMPGETVIKTAGKVNFNDDLQYVFNQNVKSQDIKMFASVFGIDLTKLAADENKKAIFKRLSADLQLKGDWDNFAVYAPQVDIDSTKLGFDIRVSKEEDKTFLNADVAVTKILFDKYVQALPEKMKDSSYKDKFIYQLKLIPWNNYNTEARISIDGAVYNKIPMENISLQFSKEGENLNVKSLSIKNIANASLDMTADAEEIFTNPNFKELTYNVKTSNFPFFASSLSIRTGDKNLFKRKLFAAQGAMAGTFNEFSLSSVQKFGDAEFSYTGVVTNPEQGEVNLSGDLELKTNNFTNFVKALNIDYTPTIPVTTFSAVGKLNGNMNTFEYGDINAHLGANSISGLLQFDHSSDKPKVKADLDFDRFDADHWLNLSHKKRNTTADDFKFIAPITFSDKKIDYSSLSKVDFDIKAKSRSLIYNNAKYLTTNADVKLKDGNLNVVLFETQDESSKIAVDFLLKSGDEPTIKGKYSISDVKTPSIGGRVYQLSGSRISAEGTFDSVASSEKEFFDNLNSNGNFRLNDTTFKGWDLDIIKFDLEQRKTSDGFKEFILRHLQNGQSDFTKISGNYAINKGIVSADNVLWESPVANIEMTLNLDLKTNTFKADFDTIYHNASFSDILKFTLDGDISAPKLDCQLEEIINRLNDTEKTAASVIKQKENEKALKIQSKTESIKSDIKEALSKILAIKETIADFKPASADTSTQKTYAENVDEFNQIEQNINSLNAKLSGKLSEKALMDMEAELKVELSKLAFIPKNLEDNYILDNKYTYDGVFNKIAWLYDLATHNMAYFEELSNSYIMQVALMKTGETALSPADENLLLNSVNTVTNDMEKITDIYTKMRDDYLFIVDTNNIEVMKDNNEIVAQALKSILSETKTLNKDIIFSLEAFEKTLELSGNNFKENLIQVPENADSIDVSTPIQEVKPVADALTTEETISTDNEEVEQENSQEELSKEAALRLEEDKKKIERQQAQLLRIRDNISTLINNMKSEQQSKKDMQVASNINSGGLSALIPVIEENTPEETPVEEKPVVAENIIEETVEEVSAPEVIQEEPIVIAEQPEEETAEVIVAKQEIVPEPNIENEPAAVTPTPNEEEKVLTAEADINQKMQTALNDMMEQVKKEEEIVLSSLNEDLKQKTEPVEEKQNNIIEPENINITDFTITEPVIKHTHKRNPVIAFGIGKDFNSPALSDLKRIDKKEGFKSKQHRYNDVVKSFAEKSQIALPIAINKAIMNRDTTQKSRALPTTVSPTESLIASYNQMGNMTAQPQETSNTQNLYVFAADDSSVKLSGISGKNMLKEKQTIRSEPSSTQYLYAANDSSLSKFSGLLGKSSRLNIK